MLTSKAPEWEKIKNVEAFSVGTKRNKSYTADDLKEMVDNFNKFGKGQRPGFDVPTVYGHDETPEEQAKFLQNTGIRADGWVEGAKTDGKKLYLDLRVAPRLAEAIRTGHYSAVSIEIYDKPPQGIPGKGKMIRRLAVLGGEIPQDKNLRRLPLPEKYSETRSRRRLITTHLRDCIQHRDYYTCFSEVAMPTRDEMVQKLAEKGVNPDAMKAAPDECLAEMCRMAEDMGKGKEDLGMGGMDFDSDPKMPASPAEKKMYGELHRKMSAYAEKLKKFAEEEPIPGVSQVHPGPSGSEKAGLGGPSEDVKKMSELVVRMSEKLEQQGSLITALRAEIRPIKEDLNQKHQVDIALFCERMKGAGKLTQAQLDRKNPLNTVDELLRLNREQKVHKFSEGGKQTMLSDLELRMKAIEAGPVVWKNSELAASNNGGALNSDGTDPAHARIERFCEEKGIKESVRKEMIEGWEAMKKAVPNADVVDYLTV